MEKEIINKIFDNLENWKNLPKYQLERRLDIFLTPFLKNTLEINLKIELDNLIIPEFPINVNLVNALDKSNKEYKTENATKEFCFNQLINKKIKQQSFNIDYLMFSKDKKVAYFIELKTDNNSFNDSQKTRMLLAKNYYSFNEQLIGLKEICTRSKSKIKYNHLIKSLMNKSLNEYNDVEKFETQVENIEIVYLLPVLPKNINTDDKINFITFDKISDSIITDDNISKRLKNILMNILSDEKKHTQIN